VVPFCTPPLTIHLTKIVVKVVGNGEITLTNRRERLESFPFQKLKSELVFLEVPATSFEVAPFYEMLFYDTDVF
jgi:hypothetical protein